MGLSFDKHVTHFASLGESSVYWCVGQQNPKQNGELQTREGKGAQRSESWTPCLSRTKDGFLAPICHPRPDLPLCAEEETVQKTFRVVTGSGSPKTVTDMGQVLACSYRPLFSCKTRQSSQVGLTGADISLPFST